MYIYVLRLHVHVHVYIHSYTHKNFAKGCRVGTCIVPRNIKTNLRYLGKEAFINLASLAKLYHCAYMCSSSARAKSDK